jgi:signal transduction histidine kinase
MRTSLFYKALRTVVPYTLFGALWILGSDLLLAGLVHDVELITRISIYKGWLYVGITSVLLLFLVWNRLRSDQALQDRLDARQMELEEFIFATSHHLRSPLVNIEVFTGELEAALKTGEAVERHEFLALASQIRKNTHTMGKQLVGLARLHRALRDPPRPQPLLLQEMLAQLLKRSQNHYGVAALHMEMSAVLPKVYADPKQTEVLFSEIFDNALRYREPLRQLELRISAESEHGHTTITVQDNGPGFANANSQQIFQPIQRHPTSAEPGALHIGLAIAWRCARWNGGDLRVESLPGQGTKILVSLPLA